MLSGLEGLGRLFPNYFDKQSRSKYLGPYSLFRGGVLGSLIRLWKPKRAPFLFLDYPSNHLFKRAPCLEL